MSNKERIEKNNEDLAEIKSKLRRIPKPITQDKTITENGVYTADEGYSGLGEVTVNVEGGGSGYTGHVDVEGLKAIGWTDEDIQELQENVWWNADEDEIFALTDFDKTNSYNQIRFGSKYDSSLNSKNYLRVIAIPSKRYNESSNNFSGAVNLKYISDNVTYTYPITLASMFYNCKSLKKMPRLNFDLSKMLSTTSMFYNCYNLEYVSDMLEAEPKTMNNMFYNCQNLKKIPKINTSLCTNISGIFYGCGALYEVMELNCEKCTNISNMFSGCYNLIKIGGLKDLGKGYPTNIIANNNNARLTLTHCAQLTHESCMNILNGVYDIASLGILPQNIVFNDKISLTDEEIAIVTNKGWNVTFGNE